MRYFNRLISKELMNTVELSMRLVKDCLAGIVWLRVPSHALNFEEFGETREDSPRRNVVVGPS